MYINTDKIVTMTAANQNFSAVRGKPTGTASQ